MKIKTLKRLLCLCAVMFSISSCNDSDPYREGMHWDYSIACEGGFIYKTLDHHRGTILILNSDGTPLRCGKKIY
jgi:hypothetical protein